MLDKIKFVGSVPCPQVHFNMMNTVKDNLLRDSLSQSDPENKHWTLEFPCSIGSPIQLSTLHRQNEYKSKGKKGKKHITNLMPYYIKPRQSGIAPSALFW